LTDLNVTVHIFDGHTFTNIVAIAVLAPWLT